MRKLAFTLSFAICASTGFAGRWVEPSQAYIWEWEIADGEAVKVSRTVYDTLKYEKEQSGGRLDVPASFDGCKVVELRDIVGKFTSISIPNTVRRISGRIDGEMKRFVIPDTVTTIGDSAFRHYSQLKLVTTASGWSIDKREINEDSDLAIVLPDGLMTIESDAFASCDNLKFVRTPNTITSIGEGAFSGCSNLRDAYVAMGGGADIGRSAFSGCEQLHGVHILGGVTNIGNSAFYGCTWLSQLELPDGLLRIGENIIGETRLSDVRIPASVKDIGCLKYHAADDSCSSLRSVTFDGDAPSCFRCWVAEYEYDLANPTYPRPTESTEVYVWPWFVASYENLSFTYYTTHSSFEWSPTKIIPRTDALIKFDPKSRSVLTNENVIILEKPHQGIDLYYTINGGTPDKTSARYTGKIELPLGESTVRVAGYWCGDGKVCTSAGSWASYTVIEVPVRTITFDANGGECNVSELRRNEGSPYGTLPIPTRTGYVFDGWWTQAEGGGCIGQSCVVSSDVKIYAHWLKEITITFDANGGSCLTEHCVTTNERLFSELPKASREGFAFDGWWTSKEGGKKVDVDFIADSHEIVLYAHWVNFAKLIKDISAERSGGVVKISYRMVCALIDDGYSILRFYKDRNEVRQIRSETGDLSVVEGRHEIVWNYKKDGLGDIDEDAKIVVAVMRRVDAPYCCVNLQSLNDETNGICYSDKPCEASDCLLFRYVPAGEMQIDGNKIALTRPYYLMLSPLMQHQYEIIMGNVGPGDDYVEQVAQISYNDARGAFSTIFGNAYATFPTDRVTPESLLGIFSKRTGLNCDLPTEAQWDFAYTSGLGQYGQYPWGATSNLWGFCHMEDNWEWCRDDYNWYSMGRKFGVDPLYEERVVFEYCAKVHKKGTAREIGYSNTRASMRICILPTYDDFYDDVARSECGISIYYKVTFDAQGGDVQESEIEILNGRAIGELPVAERTGYGFLGWFTMPDGGEAISVNTIVSDDVTYYAHWEWIGDYEWDLKALEDGTAAVMGVIPSPSGQLVIPHTICGKTVSVIGISAFSGCEGLTAVTIPSGVTSIEYFSFKDCCGLRSVVIPSSVVTIGWYAFDGCGKIESVTIPACVKRLSSVFPSAYQNIADVNIAAGTLKIDDIAFSDCTGLITVAIPSSVTSIGYGAFSRCCGLKSITIPSCVTNIGHSAFYGCIGLSSIIIPSGVKTIDNYVFEDCGNLESVEIAEGVESIGSRVFSGCGKLMSITIPSSVTSIGDGAFRDCGSLSIVHVDNDDAERVRTMMESSGFDVTGLKFEEVERKVLRVTFDAAEGTVEKALREVVYDTVIGELPIASREGHEFLGWFTAVEGGTQLRPDAIITEDVTYYAHWRILHYNISYDLCGGINAGGNPSSYTVEDAVTLADPVREGYEFVGWSPDHGVIAKGSTGDRAFVASWKQRTQGSGLVAWYKFDGNADDSSGYANRGTIHGTTWAQDRNGNLNSACSFGGDDWISVPHSDSLSVDAVTVSVWVKLTSWHMYGGVGHAPIVCKANTYNIEGSYRYQVELRGGSRICCADIDMGNYFALDCWQMLTITHGNGQRKVYLDGELVGESSSSNPTKLADELCIGRNIVGATEYYNGLMDDLRIYNRALTAIEVKTLYEGDGLVAWYKFDGNLNDESGNGYDMQGTSDGYVVGHDSIGQALSFSGGTSVSPENVIEVESSFTISCWLKSEENIAVVSERSSGIQTNGKMVLTPGHGATEGAGIGFAYGKNGVAIYEHGSSYLPVVLMYNAAIGTGWNFVTITVADNAAPKLYLNGKFVRQGVRGDRNYRCVKLGKDAASIGGEFYGNRFYGNVDDFRIYNRALSESEIEALCNGDFAWQPVDVTLPKEVSGSAEIAIPASWVTEFLPRQYGEDSKMQFMKMYGSDYGAALLKKSGKVDCAGNELLVWQDYVAGTDPTDSNSLFRAFIDMVNGCPQIRWEPNLNATDNNRIYTVFGKYELSDEQWHSPTNDRSRFFKVSVEMP